MIDELKNLLKTYKIWVENTSKIDSKYYENLKFNNDNSKITKIIHLDKKYIIFPKI